MNVLMLAPHPFFQVRGTPIAADLVLKVLSQRGEYVDLVTFPEGENVYYPNVSIFRTPRFRWLENIRPGFSWKKLVCDFFLLLKALKLARTKKYDVIHAGEEAVFIALLIKLCFGIPYVYDMDSSLVDQLMNKYRWLKGIAGVLRGLEGLAIGNAKAVIAVCQTLADYAQRHHPKKVIVLPDISLLNYVPHQGDSKLTYQLAHQADMCAR